MRAHLITDPQQAGKLLASGHLVAFPTETVYGLGVDATNAAAVERLFAVKGRPSNNPLIVHIQSQEQLTQVALSVPRLAERLLDRFAPGPLTVVVPKRPEIVAAVTAGLETVGVRIPDNPLALAMLAAAQRPIAAPSANRSGLPSATTWQAVSEDFGEQIDAILVGDPARVGLESTVVDCVSWPPRILRPGRVSLEQLREIEAAMQLAGPTATNGENSPGRLHPHYRPRATVRLISQVSEAVPDKMAAYVGLELHPHAAQFGWCASYATLELYAHQFYEALREVDRRQLERIYLQRVKPEGLGLALTDRLERAAEPTESSQPGTRLR